MYIFVISDSHGNKEGIKKIFDNYNFDYLFFLGDGLADIENYLKDNRVFVVSGNCDIFSSVPNELFVELEGKRFFLTHGNKYGVKYTLEALVEKGIVEGVDFVFFGHTHIPYVDNINNIYYINPGSFKRNYNNQSVGIVLNIENNSVKITELVIDTKNK